METPTILRMNRPSSGPTMSLGRGIGSSAASSGGIGWPPAGWPTTGTQETLAGALTARAGSGCPTGSAPRRVLLDNPQDHVLAPSRPGLFAVRHRASASVIITSLGLNPAASQAGRDCWERWTPRKHRWLSTV